MSMGTTAPVTAGLSGLLALAVGCGSGAPDPTVLPLGFWGAEHAAAACAKMFSCCDTGEQTTLRFADEAECRNMLGEAEQSAVSQTVAQGFIVYDSKAARRCVNETMAASCSAFFNDPDSGAPSCNSVVRGALPLGAACEDLDVICESGYCTGTCSPRPGCSAPCDAGQFCDLTTSACSPTKADGSSCHWNYECTAPSVCRMGVCGPPLADGTPNCQEDVDCASGRCTLATPDTTGCAAKLPDDNTCSRDEDCSSGACLGIDPAQLTCMTPTPMPDGSPCARNAQCTSGQCVVRAKGAMATCGAPYCDGV